MDRFSYFVNDALQNVLALRVYSLDGVSDFAAGYKAALQKIYISDPLLKLPYQKVRISVGAKGHSFIPNRLYHPERKRSYLSQIVELSSDARIDVDEMPAFDAKNVYLPDEGLLRLLEGYFSNAKVYHSCTPALQGFRRISAHYKDHNVFVSLNGREVHVVLLEGKQFLFSNIFQFQSSRDFIYYIMLVYDQFKLKPESIPVYIAGDILKDSEIYQLLYRYIRHLKIIQAPDYLHFGEAFKNLSHHFYFDLYSLKLCE